MATQVPFGDFVLDLDSRELRRGGEPLKLSPKALQLLEILATSRPKAFSKAELQDRLWPGTFVVEKNLANLVTEIRDALGDNPSDQRFIRTVPRYGYAFREQTPVAPLPARPASKTRPSAVAVVAGLFCVVAAIAGFWWVAGRAASTATTIRVLSDFPGGSGGASLSPDGTMVAFHRAHVDERGVVGTFQIWVKSVTGGQPLQLTFDDASAASPCWSPKGDQILFNHRLGTWSVSPLGGAPRLVIERGANPRFSADGNQVVFEDDRGVWIADSTGSHRRQIARKDFPFGASPALSPDSRWVAFFQSEGGPFGDIWVAPADGDSARRLTFDSSEAGGPAWTPDGRFVIFYSSRAGSQTLWRIPAQGGEPEPVTSGAGQDRDPDISADGKRLVYSNFRVTYVLMLHDPATGRERELLQRRELVSMPRLSPDGGRIAFAQRVDRDTHVFTVRVDGHELRQITEGSGQQNVMPQWSEDGAWIRFLRERPTLSLQQVSAVGGDSRELMSWPGGAAAEIDPSGRAVVYSKLMDKDRLATIVRSLATGHETVFDMAVEGARWSPDGRTFVGWQPVPAGASSRVVSCTVPLHTCRVVADPGASPVMTADGSRILFLRRASPFGPRMWALWSTRPDGHDAKQVATLGPLGLDVVFDVSRTGEIVYPQRRETRSELWLADLR